MCSWFLLGFLSWVLHEMGIKCTIALANWQNQITENWKQNLFNSSTSNNFQWPIFGDFQTKYLIIRRVIINEKVKLLLTLYRPIPPPLFFLVKPKLLAPPPQKKKMSVKPYVNVIMSASVFKQIFILDQIEYRILFVFENWANQITNTRMAWRVYRWKFLFQ